VFPQDSDATNWIILKMFKNQTPLIRQNIGCYAY